jgi:hypothetical protein
MLNKSRFLVVLAVLMVSSVVFGAIAPHQKLMAKRAAELDAYRNMAERIMGLKISSETHVLDFVVLSDEIKTSMDHFIKGLRIDDKLTTWYDDGTCEVVVEVTLSKVIKELKTTVDRFYKGDKWTEKSFDEVNTYTEKRVLTEYGSGAVSATSVVAEYHGVPIVMELTNPRDKRITLPAIYKKYPARNRLMAKRIATVDAYRKLIERIYGLQITSKTTVRDYDSDLSSDHIRGLLNQEIKGLKVEEIRYQADGIVEVQASLTLKQVVKTLKKVCDDYYDQTGKKIKSNKFEEIENQTKRRTIAVMGMGAISGSGKGTQSTSGMQGQSSGSRVLKNTVTTIIIEEPEVIEIK